MRGHGTPPGEEGRASRDEGGKAVSGGQSVRLRGISRPSRHSKCRSTAQAGEISPEREITRPRVQACAEPGKMRGILCPRPDAHLTYMINIALTTEFAITAGDVR